MFVATFPSERDLCDNDITIFIFRFSFQTKIITVINFIAHANLSTCETEKSVVTNTTQRSADYF